jgi:LPS O-antigen subunit length determinant protein (WzzB/FepE family)
MQSYYQQDEISLIDLWRMLTARKLLILGVLFASLVAGGLLIYSTETMYESRTVLHVGKVEGVGQLESPGEMVQRLREEYRVDDRSEGPIEPPYVSDVSTQGPANIVVIKAQGATAEQASDFLQGVATKVIRGHQQVFDDIRFQLQDRLQSLQRQKDRVTQSINLLENRIRSLGNEDASMGAMLTLEKTNLLQQLPGLEGQINSLQLKLSSVQSNPTTLMRQPTLPVGAIQPKPMLTLALAGMIGILLGIFAAFAAEFLSRAREQMAAAENNNEPAQ